MAKNAYIGIDNVARKVKQPYIGVDNVARKVKSGYVGIDNVARECFSLISATSVGDLAVGTSVYINNCEMIVIQQGLPSDAYDSSCDGTWLMMKDSMITAYSGIDLFLTENIYTHYLGPAVKEIVKNVFLPRDTGGGGVLNAPYQAFFLSSTEIGLNNGAVLDEGTVLDYFKDGDTSKLICHYKYGSYDYGAMTWWLRTVIGTTAYIVTATGTLSTWSTTTTSAMVSRAAIILPPDTPIDENYNVIV